MCWRRWTENDSSSEVFVVSKYLLCDFDDLDDDGDDDDDDIDDLTMGIPSASV